MSHWNGRLNRAGYWLALSATIILVVTVNMIGARHAAMSELVLVFICVPRLHDIGKSGWFVLIGLFIELAGIVIGLSFVPLAQAKSVFGVATLLIAGLLIWLGSVPGNSEANRWGEPPTPGIAFGRHAKTQPDQ